MSDLSLAVGLGLVCALLSALATNLAFLFKHRGAVAAPAVEMRHPLRSARDLFRSKWWSVGWAVAAVAFALHVAALSLAPISIGQAVLAGGLVFLAVLAERFFGFEPGPAPVDRDRPGGGVARGAHADGRRRRRRRELRLLARGHDRLREHRRRSRPAAGLLAPDRPHPGAARRAARSRRRARVRHLRRCDQGALGRPRARPGRAAQPLERDHPHGGRLLVLRLRPQPADRRRRRGDRRHVGCGQPVHDRRRAGGLRRPARE